jgi:hypothetical protein
LHRFRSKGSNCVVRWMWALMRGDPGFQAVVAPLMLGILPFLSSGRL